MSNAVFPHNLPGLDIKVERETIWATKVQTSVSGKEQRTAWQSAPRYRYTLTLNVLRTGTNAPAPNQAYTETGVIQQFLDQHKGQWDSFLFTDPFDSVQRRVRFVADSIAFERVVDAIWAVKKIQLISVL